MAGDSTAPNSAGTLDGMQPLMARRALRSAGVSVSLLTATLLTIGCAGSPVVGEVEQGQILTSAPVGDEPEATEQDPQPEVPELSNEGRRQVPPLSLPAVPPGTDEAYSKMVGALSRFLTAEQVLEIPWPDLRNPDPVVAYQSCAQFQSWIARNAPNPVLVEAYTAPESPEREFDLAIFGSQYRQRLLATQSVPEYSMRVEGIAHPAATEISANLLAQVPVGSVAVIYFDSVGRYNMIDAQGEVVATKQGWQDIGPWIAIMAPTEVGWQVWWDELASTIPEGLRRRGQTQVDIPRSSL